MSEMIHIKLSKTTLAITRQNLLECLSLRPEILEKAIKQGKYNLRHNQVIDRQLKTNAMGFGKWQLYEILKADNKKVDDEVIGWISGMDHLELREGLIEYLLYTNQLIS